MEESGYSTPGGTQLSRDDVSKLLEDREKAKVYIRNCQAIMQKQSEQLKAQQDKFKTTLSNLESQHHNTRFHAIALKLELESHKLFMVARKKASLLTHAAFHRFRAQTRPPLPFQAVANLRLGLRLLDAVARKANRLVYRRFLQQWSRRVFSNADALQQKIQQLESELVQLKSSKVSPNYHKVLELQEENEALREKIQSTENSVGMFVGEMSKLLDQHEPPGFREFMEKQTKKVKRQTKAAIKARARHSPEHSAERNSAKKSAELHRLNFY